YQQVDLIISDDGLQHYALGRDVEIVLFDARGGGNGWLMPAGPLREPLSRPRDFTVVNGGQAPGIEGEVIAMHLVGEIAYALNVPSRTHSLADLANENTRGLKLVAAAGIGNPA